MLQSPTNNRILYLHLPGLLSQAIHHGKPQAVNAPLAVAQGRFVRDACPLALAQGVRVGMNIVQARRLCPGVLIVLREEIDPQSLSRRLWDTLADLSPIVEPEDADAGYADLTGLATDLIRRDLEQRIIALFGQMPRIGLGISRLAARACAGCGLPSDRLGEASVEWLWPEDKAVLGRLQRLGLTNFGAVAEAGEAALRLHFGKIAPLLWRRAHGVDLTPVRALYPPPCVEVARRFEDAVVSHQRLDAELAQMSMEAAERLRGLGGHGRWVVLRIETERGDARDEWVVPAPVRTAGDVSLAVRRLLARMHLAAPITAVSIAVRDVSAPAAHTPDLFCMGPGADPVALEAVRRRLAARFGLTTLTTPSQWPKAARDRRRAALHDRWLGAPW